MKTILISTASVVLAFASVAFAADDSLKQIQQALRQQGYYYGEMDGKNGDETQHAIRRFQIRNGLKVTGQLDGTTRQAILSAKSDVEPSLPGEDTSDLRSPDSATVQQDKAFLKGGSSSQKSKSPTLSSQPPGSSRSTSKPAPSSQAKTKRAPASNSAPASSSVAGLFRDSPYARASAAEQQRVLRSVQNYLVRYRYYRGPVDGVAGMATVDGIMRYQRAARLRPTGKLDGDTLELMGMLPARRETRRERYYARENYRPAYSIYWGGYYPGSGRGYYVPVPRYSFGWGFY